MALRWKGAGERCLATTATQLSLVVTPDTIHFTVIVTLQPLGGVTDFVF
jgi:hypothetical protein